MKEEDLDSSKTRRGLLRVAKSRTFDATNYPSDEDIQKIAFIPLGTIKKELAQMGALDTPVPRLSALRHRRTQTSTSEIERERSNSMVWSSGNLREKNFWWLSGKPSHPVRIAMSLAALPILIFLISNNLRLGLLKSEDSAAIPAVAIVDSSPGQVGHLDNVGTTVRSDKENQITAVEGAKPHLIRTASSSTGMTACNTISECAFQLLTQRVNENRNSFFVYKDADSAFNHSFPSGLFGPIDLNKVNLESNCIDDPASATGCSTDTSRLDTTHGTVFSFKYPTLTGSEFVGLNWQEPEHYNGQPSSSVGYNLTPATMVRFDARSPDNAKVQFGVGGCVTGFYQLGPTWTTQTFSIADLIPPPGVSNISCPTDLTNVHVLFTVTTNASMSPQGGIVLLDNIEYLPVPDRQNTVLSLPLGTQTFGVVAQTGTLPNCNSQPINIVSSDQANRNLAPIYEAAATALALLKRGESQDVNDAMKIVDALDYALHHDNHGIPLPVASDGSRGLRSAYQGGDIALLNGQSSDSGAQAGDVRLAGFSVKDVENKCGTSGVCFNLVLDGATGGNNAWAMLALLAAHLKSGDTRYLNDAEEIGKWIVGTLRDPSNSESDLSNYGGYFVGFNDGGIYSLNKGKSTENNGDIFVAFSLVAQIETSRGNPADAARWQLRANEAGDFVMQMFDPAIGRFYVGTVPAVPSLSACPARGICQSPPIQKGNDVINVCDFLDSNSFTALPMAASSQYGNQIDWRRPVQYLLNTFAQTITAGGHTYHGYNIVSSPSSGPNGIAWEFTGQAVVAARFIDSLYSQTTFESSADSTLNQIRQAQTSAPFGDGLGLPASTLQDGDKLAPLNQCLDTPFQCIPERVGLAATTWAIFADQKFNPLWFGSLAFSSLTPPFPQQLVGTTSPPSTIIVTNTAVAPVTFAGAVTVTGSNKSDFTVSDNCHSAPLAPGASCAITITFTPSAAGDHTATLVIKDDALGSPQTIPLNAIGMAVNDFSIQVLPGSQPIIAGNKAVYTIQTQTTRGSAQPVKLSVSCPGLSCSVEATDISAGGSATLTVLTTVSTAPNSYSIAVTGTSPEVTHTTTANLKVTSAASLSSQTLSFAAQQVGTTSPAKTVTLTNNSSSPLPISAIAIGGAFSGDFAQTNNCGSSLAAGASCLIDVTFKPAGVDTRTATLFVSDVAGDSPQTVELRGVGSGSCTSLSDCVFQSLNQSVVENQTRFYVFKDADSGFNHGFPALFFSSGFIPDRVKLEPACVDDLISATGCTTDPGRFDVTRGNVFHIGFPPLASGEFAGLLFKEPQDFDPQKSPGIGYDLRPATMLQFDARSPDGIRAQFGVGNCVTDFIKLDPSWKTITLNLTNACPSDISNTHILFSVGTNANVAPAGGSVLLDNIQFLPVPARQRIDPKALSYPVANQTFGVVANERLPIPIDQVNRNLATISASALTVLALLQRGEPEDVTNALQIANTFHYALYHDNHGDPIPAASPSSEGCYSGLPAPQCGLHSAYINGDIAFLNNQPSSPNPVTGLAGEVRLAGFSAGEALCGPSRFCLVLDGATGGDNAWAIMALLAAYRQSGETKYLNDARVIGNWISGNLKDTTGYGGYFLGYNDGGLPKQLIHGKSTIHNAQIFVAFGQLAQAEVTLGNSQAATEWRNRAGAAANFVLQMFDSENGRFYAGTINAPDAGIQAPGLCPDVSKKRDNDVVNTCDSLDSDTITTLALAGSYPNQINWTRPMQYALDHFNTTATVGEKTFSGFNLIRQGTGQTGVAWEFTSQMALAMKVVDANYGSSQFASSVGFYLDQVRQAQLSAPFGDGKGVGASTLSNGDTLPPYAQCLKTPFQCIAERVGLGASAWAVLADLKFNPLNAGPSATPTPTPSASPNPTPSPIELILDTSGPAIDQSAALDSMIFLRDPFPVVNTVNLLNPGPDRNTRVVIFVTNLQLAPGETAASVVVSLIDSRNQIYDLAAEDVRPVPNFSFTQVVFRLPDGLSTGTCSIRVKAHGQVSNTGTIRIRI
jgi:hypothetical protein